MCLLWPFNEVYAIAVHSFSSQELNQLTLNKNDKVLILGKEAQDMGWWRGRYANKVKDVLILLFNFLFKYS